MSDTAQQSPDCGIHAQWVRSILTRPNQIRQSPRPVAHDHVAACACSPRQRLLRQRRTRGRIASHHTHRGAVDRDCRVARRRSAGQPGRVQVGRAEAVWRAPRSSCAKTTRRRPPREQSRRPPAPGRSRAVAHRRGGRGSSGATPPRQADARTRSERSCPRIHHPSVENGATYPAAPAGEHGSLLNRRSRQPTSHPGNPQPAARPGSLDSDLGVRQD